MRIMLQCLDDANGSIQYSTVLPCIQFMKHQMQTCYYVDGSAEHGVVVC